MRVSTTIGLRGAIRVSNTFVRAIRVVNKWCNALLGLGLRRAMRVSTTLGLRGAIRVHHTFVRVVNKWCNALLGFVRRILRQDKLRGAIRVSTTLGLRGAIRVRNTSLGRLGL